jgi:hypothetical protein
MSVNKTLVTSYITLRKFIGLLGIALPIVLFLGGLWPFHTGLRPSLSDYYHTGMRDVFVGTLWAIGVFMVSYRGFDKRDDIAGNLACFFAVGLSIFPVAPVNPTSTEKIVGHLHFIFAAAFFLTLVYFSLFLFTLTDKKAEPTPEKLKRNHVYRTCGWVMLVCVAGIAVFKMLFADEWVRDHKVVFVLETIAIVTFGVSWLVKGEAILGDKRGPGEQPNVAAAH